MNMTGTVVLIYPNARPSVTFDAAPALHVYANYLTGVQLWLVTYYVNAAITIPDTSPITLHRQGVHTYNYYCFATVESISINLLGYVKYAIRQIKPNNNAVDRINCIFNVRSILSSVQTRIM